MPSFFEETPAEEAFRHADDARHLARSKYAGSIGMAQTAKLTSEQRKLWEAAARKDRAAWDAAERTYRAAAKVVGVAYARLPTYAENPRTGRPYDPEKKGSRRGFEGLGAAAASCAELPSILDRAEVALEVGDAEGLNEALRDYTDTVVRRRCKTSQRFFELESSAERLSAKSRVYGREGVSLSGLRLRGACEDAQREAARALREAKTPAQRRAAQKYMKQVKSRCGLGRLRGTRLGGKR